MSLSKTLYLLLVQPRMARPDMTEKLLTGTVSKQSNTHQNWEVGVCKSMGVYGKMQWQNI